MNGRRLFVQLTLLAMLLAGGRLVLAKGSPEKVVIRGEGLAEPVEITDRPTLGAFSFFVFEQVETNFRRGIEKPQVGAGYELTRFIHRQDGSLLAWDMVHYYPDPSGQGGYVYVDGLIGPSYTEFDGKWYPVSAKGDAAMRRLLAEHRITLPAPPALPAAGNDPRLALWLMFLAVTLAGLGGLLRLLHTRHR
jgi:hypothetical protein